MSQGSLMFPLGYMPLNDSGEPVPGGKLVFSRTGTSTAQDTYSDSTLDTANSNPVELDASGRVATKIYGNPASGFDYRVKFTTSADVQIWQFDDVKVDGAATATLAEGSFTGTLTGMDATTNGTVNYRILANSAGTGKVCVLYLSSEISGTSNTTAMTMTGLPAAVTPSAARNTSLAVAIDNGASVSSLAQVGTGGTITFFTDEPLSSTGWTNSGSKGLGSAWTINYPL